MGGRPTLQQYETKRFRLRHISTDDIEPLFHNFSDPLLMKHYDMRRLERVEEIEELLLRWKAAEISGTGCRWAIADRISDRLIGTIGLHGINRVHGRCETGYEISRAAWGCGVMSEVLPQVLYDAFEVRNLFRIGALVVPANKASIRLLQKFGFRREGVMRGYMKRDGASVDMATFGLLETDNSEWQSLREERISLTL